MGARSRRPSVSLAWRDRQTYLGHDLATPMCHTDSRDGQRHIRNTSGARRAYSTSNVPSRTPSACDHHSASEAAQWLTRETTQHQRLSLRRLEVDWLHPDLQSASPQAAMNNQAQKEFNLSNNESRARGITSRRKLRQITCLDKRSVDHSLARTEHKRPEPIKTHEDSVAIKVSRPRNATGARERTH